MAITEVYVDPSIAADSGTGTIGDPYGDLEYAIEQTTYDTSNGTRINVKAGTAEVLAADLDTAFADIVTTAAWNPTDRRYPAIIQGYTAAAGDGGIAQIDTNGNGFYNNGTRDIMHFVDLDIYGGCGANKLINCDQYCIIRNCELQGPCTASQFIDIGGYSLIDHCYIHNNNVTTDVVFVSTTGAAIRNSTIVVGSGEDPTRIVNLSSGTSCHNNIIIVNDANSIDGIRLTNGGKCWSNSIYSSVAGTGWGIVSDTTSSPQLCANNLVEGFSGTGGRGISIASSNVETFGNAVYNCTTAYTFTNDAAPGSYWGDNETLTASPFTDAASNDFSPVDTGNVKEGALPQTFGTAHA
jgi:hypothetical protein